MARRSNRLSPLEALSRALGLLCFVWSSWAHALIAAEPAKELTIEATIAREGFAMAFGFDALWMMSKGQLVRVNASDNAVVEIPLPSAGDAGLLPDVDRYRGLAVGEGAVWIPEMASSTIFKVDPEINLVTLAIPTDIFGAQGSIGVGEGGVWVVTFDDRNKSLTRYDAISGARLAKIALPSAGAGVIVAYDAVWVTAATRAEIYRIDPEANSVVATLPIHAPTHLIAAGHGSIWLSFPVDGVVQRLDGVTGDLIAALDTHITGTVSDGDLAAGDGFVWTINRSSRVGQIDPGANKVKGIFQPPAGTTMGRRLQVGGGAVWISGGAIFRIRPSP
jgi:virginiamycin B lyase